MPWKAIDVVVAFLLYFAMPMCVVQMASGWFGGEVAAPASADANGDVDSAHPLARLLLTNPSAWVILACAAAAVVVAPATEEFLFRLVLQGWLEAVERRVRRRASRLRSLPFGTMSVVAASLLFAALHFRVPIPRIDLDTLVFLTCARAVANLLAVGCALCWMRFAAGATLADFGVVPRKLAADVKLGMLAFPLITIPVYILLIGLKPLLPENAIVDPIPIFLLAVVLGGLYARTHRIVPSIVLHMAFNATGVILALWASR